MTLFFNGGYSPSLELEVGLSLEIECLGDTYCFTAPAFAYARVLLNLCSFFSFSASFFWATIRAFNTFPLEGIGARGEGVLGLFDVVPLIKIHNEFDGSRCHLPRHFRRQSVKHVLLCSTNNRSPWVIPLTNARRCRKVARARSVSTRTCVGCLRHGS